MCGILGFIGDNTKANRLLIEKLMLQLSLRGTHATGLAFQSLHMGLGMVIEPIPAEAFFQLYSLDELLPDPQFPLALIGHTRYSTSDLAWNQPIEREGTAVVMNGVISQELPCDWPAADLMDYQTANDAEIALMFALTGQRGRMPGSFACCELNEGELLCYRNTDRPLWWGRGKDYTVVASTQDALLRSGVKTVRQLPAGKVYDLFPSGIVARTNEMDYKPEIVHLGDVQETFPVDELDLQSAELLFGAENLKCLL